MTSGAAAGLLYMVRDVGAATSRIDRVFFDRDEDAASEGRLGSCLSAWQLSASLA
jgi:hypothetical protein